jgi:malonyl CoA-acyl carrier protein transacylase
MTTYIFPGQGSQAKGMGTDLFPHYSALLETADAILGYSVASLCLDDLQEQLNLTQFTQPALYVINALSYYHKIESGCDRPDYVAGHSLGEYNALLAANVFDFETGLRLVKKRSELMSQAANGSMAAIIGLKSETIKDILEKNHLNSVTIANYNSHLQTVISGQKDELDNASSLCEQAGAMMVVALKVSGAFHSPLMKKAQHEFDSFLSQFRFLLPSMPVISNVTAKPYHANELQQHLVKQISNPVRWTETIEYLISQGVTDFQEIGPGSTLAGLIRRIKIGQ